MVHKFVDQIDFENLADLHLSLMNPDMPLRLSPN